MNDETKRLHWVREKHPEIPRSMRGQVFATTCGRYRVWMQGAARFPGGYGVEWAAERVGVKPWLGEHFDAPGDAKSVCREDFKRRGST